MTDPVLLSFVDTETVSLSRDAPVAEVCVINATHDLDANTVTLDAPFNEYVELTAAEWAQADPNSMRVNKLIARHPYLVGPGQECSLASEQVAVAVARLTAERHIVGAVPNFDTERLEPFLRSRGVPFAWDHHVRDIEAMIAGFFAGLIYNVSRSEELLAVAAGQWGARKLYEQLEKVTGRAVQGPADQRHTALGDTAEVAAAYSAIFAANEQPTLL